MRAAEIRVMPVTGGWMVQAPAGLEPMLFRSGGRAEAMGLSLAAALAEAGADADLQVFDRAGVLVGVRRFPARQRALRRRPG